MRYSGKEDEKLQQFKDTVNNAVDVFINALPKMKEKMAFRAFELSDMKEEEAKNFADIILTQFAIRLKEVVPETLDIYTYNGSIVSVSENHTEVWFHAENKAPGKAERVVVADDIEVTARVVDGPIAIEDGNSVSEATSDVLVGASGMGHTQPEEHYISRATYDA